MHPREHRKLLCPPDARPHEVARPGPARRTDILLDAACHGHGPRHVLVLGRPQALERRLVEPSSPQPYPAELSAERVQVAGRVGRDIGGRLVAVPLVPRLFRPQHPERVLELCPFRDVRPPPPGGIDLVQVGGRRPAQLHARGRGDPDPRRIYPGAGKPYHAASSRDWRDAVHASTAWRAICPADCILDPNALRDFIFDTCARTSNRMAAACSESIKSS